MLGSFSGQIARCAMLLGALLLAGCASAARTPIAEYDIDTAMPYGIAKPIRLWGDTIREMQVDNIIENRIEQARFIYRDQIATNQTIEQNLLALSGGGPDGAFGAGVLAGWTARGDRPEFTMVTGVSTGAIVGLFAFLGPDYDEQLKSFYTEYETEQLLIPSIFSALTGGTALADVEGYRSLIDENIDEEILTKLAEESAKGRTLLIGTTNLDAARPVTWDLTRIAASGNPNALVLVRDIIQASSAIPGAFPPVIIPSTTQDGGQHDEMHVDGGATQQVMLFSSELPIHRIDEGLNVPVERNLYIIMNNSLKKPYEPVELGVLSITGRAVSSLISGSGSSDLYKIFAIAQRDNIDFNLTWIPKDFELEPDEAFDPVYMTALYEYGFNHGKNLEVWRKAPPDFAVGASQ
ncbi:MAG: patatin-like phospholipase family protein [Rhodospirillaceae bacterium]